MSPDQLLTELNRLATTAHAAMPHLLHSIGTHAVTYAKGNFRRQGFNGEKWKGRKKDKTPGRAILIKSGHLRASIHITSTDNDSVSIGTDLPYAKIHNEGGQINHPSREAILSYSTKGGKLKLAKTKTETQQRKIKEIRRATIKAYTQGMPKRQFLGPTPQLNTELKSLLNRELTQILTP